MIHILESARVVHFYNARYIDFYDDPRYKIGDTEDRFDRICNLLKTRQLTHIVFKTHALPRYVFDVIEPHAAVLSVYTIRNLRAALQSLLGLWSCLPSLDGDELIDKCYHQMHMNLCSLIEVHDKSHVWYFNEINSDRRATLVRLAQLMHVDVPDEVIDWILLRTGIQSMTALTDSMPAFWWETYHDIAHFHRGKDQEKVQRLTARLPELLDRLSSKVQAVQQTTGIDLLSI